MSRESLLSHDRASESCIERYDKLSPRRYARTTLRNVQRCTAFPMGTKECMVDALVSRSDEGRVMAAISFGEVPNNL